MSEIKDFTLSFDEKEVREVRNMLLEWADQKKIKHHKMAIMTQIAVDDMAKQMDLNIKDMFKGPLN